MYSLRSSLLPSLLNTLYLVLAEYLNSNICMTIFLMNQKEMLFGFFLLSGCHDSSPIHLILVVY